MRSTCSRSNTEYVPGGEYYLPIALVDQSAGEENIVFGCASIPTSNVAISRNGLHPMLHLWFGDLQGVFAQIIGCVVGYV